MSRLSHGPSPLRSLEVGSLPRLCVGPGENTAPNRERGLFAGTKRPTHAHARTRGEKKSRSFSRNVARVDDGKQGEKGRRKGKKALTWACSLRAPVYRCGISKYAAPPPPNPPIRLSSKMANPKVYVSRLRISNADRSDPLLEEQGTYWHKADSPIKVIWSKRQFRAPYGLKNLRHGCVRFILRDLLVLYQTDEIPKSSISAVDHLGEQELRLAREAQSNRQSFFSRKRADRTLEV